MPSLLKRCYLPGYFCPPTEKDLQIAYWLGRKQSEISEVVIVIGEEKNALVPAKVNQEIFDLYIHETNGDIVKTQLSGSHARFYERKCACPDICNRKSNFLQP